MANRGFAVLDFETTGLGAEKSDRVIEVAVVLVSADGQITGRFETLINPGRDTGPTHIHGIYHADVRTAPTFRQALPLLVDVLRGRTLVAHNTAFDSRFLAAEMRRAGHTSPVGLNNSMCTMILSKTFLDIDSKSLAACCAAAGIVLDDAHRASADAEATALLLSAFIAERPDWSGWASALDAAETTVWPELAAAASAPVTREHAARCASFIDQIPAGPGAMVPDEQRAGYAELVDRALLTFDPNPFDLFNVSAFAQASGLTRDTCVTLNLEHFRALTGSAWATGALTDADQRHLVAASRLLAVGAAELRTALRPPAAAEAVPVNLGAGDKIVLTGFCAADKRALGALIEEAGYVPWPSLVKTAKLLVAADTDSMSSKGRTARRLGIPIVDSAELRLILAPTV